MQTTRPEPRLDEPKLTVLVTSLIVLFGGALVLIGWYLNNTWLTSISPHYVSMKFNAAIGMMLLAVTNLIFRHERPFRGRRILESAGFCTSLLALTLGALTLVEYRFGLDLGIDQLFFEDLENRQGFGPPGRMAPVTAALLALLGTAQLLQLNRIRPSIKLAQGITLLSFVISFQALIHYLFGARDLFGASSYMQMALHTTLFFILICLGLLTTRQDEGLMAMITPQTTGGAMTRNLLLAAIFVPPFVYWLNMLAINSGLYGEEFGSLIRVTGNVTIFIVIIISNASALHAADIRNREDEEKFRAATESVPQIIFTAGVDGQIDYWNQRWYEYTGQDSARGLGGPWDQVVHPEDLLVALTRWQQSIATGATFEVEYRLKRASDHTYRWHLGRAIPVRDPKGKISRWFGTCTDIHDKKKAEAEQLTLRVEQEAAAKTQVSEARLRAIVDASFDAILAINQEGFVTDWNPRATLMFGWSPEEAIGKKLSELIVPPHNRKAHEQGMQRFLTTRKSRILNRTIEVEAQRRNGELFPIQLSVVPIQVADHFLFTAFIADITERKRNEQELIAAKQDALNASQAKSAFLATMSHEIRTPLNGIIGMTDLLLETEMSEEQRRYAKIVQDSGSGLLTIINDILDFSKIDAGKMDLEILEFNPVALVESQADLLTNKAGEKGLTLMTFIDPALPRSLLGDPGRIGQILLNLISNAIKFTDAAGRVLISARVVVSHKDFLTVRLSVQDTGIGLSHEQVDRLFKPFTQADGSTARKYGGTGLGLSICKSLADLMGGTLGVDSKPGEGSTFWLEVTLARAEAKMPTAAPLRKSLRILVVDDDPIVREILTTYLRSWEMMPLEAADAEKALQQLTACAADDEPVDLVITDNRMPGMDGFQLARILQADPKFALIPVILITAFDRQLGAKEALKQGLTGYLTKPIKQSELYDAMVTAIEKKKISPLLAQAALPEAAPRGYRILVAEDNSVNQLLILTQLRKLGYSAQAVANGREVIEALSAASYDLILMDCQMPDMDGFEATQKIRLEEKNSGHHIPIIALTANAMKEDRERCLESGMDDFVSKPTKKEILANVLLTHLKEGERKTN